MKVDELTDSVAETMEAGRRRLASVDFGKVLESAQAVALDAWPDRLSRRRSPRRWPIVAGLLVVGAILAGWLFLVPQLRSRSRGSETSPETPDHPFRAGVTSHETIGADEMSDGSKERPDGDDQHL
jgi:hypothetical protein